MVAGEQRTEPTVVYLEVGKKRVFACALDWPGWCRSGKTEEAALDALAAYAPRYGAVVAEAGLDFPAGVGDDFAVTERVRGSAGTDFGVPAETARSDTEPLTAETAERHAALVAASWVVFDRMVAHSPAELRKGPRGGGRDRDKMVDHVLGAEASYGRKLGVKHRQPDIDDSAAIADMRDDIVAVLRTPSDGTPLAAKGWPARYAARRIAWHVLDHAWEMEDRGAR